MGHLDGTPYENTKWGCSDNASGDPYVSGQWSPPLNPAEQDNLLFKQGKFTTYDEPNSLTEYTDFNTIDAFNQEWMSRGSSKILIYKIDRENTNIDTQWGEAYNDILYKPPVRIDGIYELNPIVQELSRFGIQEDEDVIVTFNMTQMLEKLAGEYITKGDILKIFLTSPRELNFQNDPKSKTIDIRYVQKIYRVASAIPMKTIRYSYVTWQTACQKTNLDMEILPEGDGV